MSDFDRLQQKLEALEMGGAGSGVLLNDGRLLRALGVRQAFVCKASVAKKLGEVASLVSLEDLCKETETYRSLAIGVDKDKELTLAVAEWASARAGELLLIGDKRLGVASVEKFLAGQMEGVAKFPLKDLGRVSLWRKNREAEPVTTGWWKETAVGRGGVNLKLCSLPGVFARGELDDGTALLLEKMAPYLRPGLRLLDLACGGGVVGTWALKKEPELKATLTDDDMNAAASARKTLEANGLRAEDLFCADGVAGLPRGSFFDLIALNPPFHQEQRVDYSVAERLFAEAASVLSEHGRLLVVANRFCPYEVSLTGHFPGVKKLHEDARFKVLECSHL